MSDSGNSTAGNSDQGSKLQPNVWAQSLAGSRSTMANAPTTPFNPSTLMVPRFESIPVTGQYAHKSASPTGDKSES